MQAFYGKIDGGALAFHYQDQVVLAALIKGLAKITPGANGLMVCFLNHIARLQAGLLGFATGYDIGHDCATCIEG